MTRLGLVHYKDARVTKEFCCDRDFFVVIDLGSDEKRKKRPLGFEASQLGIRA